MNFPNTPFQKFVQAYHTTAVVLLNCLLLVLVLYCLYVVVDLFKESNDEVHISPVSKKYGKDAVYRVYEGYSHEEAERLLIETWTRPFKFHPFTLFAERDYKGKYVNVDENGFRLTRNQGPWPISDAYFNVFVFGGSTTFGHGVEDANTIASYLQEILSERMGRKVKIYNFGQGRYYSTQERIYYQELLINGHVPDLAIFIDGLNDFFFYTNKPFLTDRLRAFIEKDAQEYSERRLSYHDPMAYKLSRIRNRLSAFLPDREQEVPRPRDLEDIEERTRVAKEVISRYLYNKKFIEAVSATMGVKTAFVWQPVPNYNYDLSLHPFAKDGFHQNRHSDLGYEIMFDLYKSGQLGNNFLWCADIQAGLTRNIYIDKVHYSPFFNEKFAAEIARLLIGQSIVTH